MLADEGISFLLHERNMDFSYFKAYTWVPSYLINLSHPATTLAVNLGPISIHVIPEAAILTVDLGPTP